MNGLSHTTQACDGKVLGHLHRVVYHMGHILCRGGSHQLVHLALYCTHTGIGTRIPDVSASGTPWLGISFFPLVL